MLRTTMLAVVLLALAAGAASQAPAPTPGAAVDCATASAGLLPCLDYVTPGSTQSKPSKECCGSVKNAVKDPATVTCLCAAFTQYGSQVNTTRAATLPAACGASPTAFSKCHINLPVASGPSGAPSPSAGAPTTGGPGSPPKSAATQSPITATILVATVAAPLLSYYYL